MFGNFLDFEAFGAGGEHLVAGFGDKNGVFDADAAEVGIIEAGFDGDDHSVFQLLMVGGGDARCFVDFEADSVSGSVDESLGYSVDGFGLVSTPMEFASSGGVDVVGPSSGLDGVERGGLRGFDGVVHFFEFGGCWSATDGAGDVAPVAGFSRPWKNVEDDGLSGAKRAGSAFVRIGGVRAAGDDGFVRDAFAVEQRMTNLGANDFGGENGFAAAQKSVFTDFGRGDLFDGGVHGGNGGALGVLYGGDFGGCFDFALRAESFFRNFQFESGAFKFFSEAERKVGADG